MISDSNCCSSIFLESGSDTVVKVMWALSNSGLEVFSIGGIILSLSVNWGGLGSESTCAESFAGSFFGVSSFAANFTSKSVGGE